MYISITPEIWCTTPLCLRWTPSGIRRYFRDFVGLLVQWRPKWMTRPLANIAAPGCGYDKPLGLASYLSASSSAPGYSTGQPRWFLGALSALNTRHSQHTFPPTSLLSLRLDLYTPTLHERCTAEGKWHMWKCVFLHPYFIGSAGGVVPWHAAAAGLTRVAGFYDSMHRGRCQKVIETDALYRYGISILFFS